MEHTLRQILHILVFLGNLSPEEHTHLRFVVRTPQHIHDLLGILPATGIALYISLTMPVVTVVVSLGSSQLDATECSALDVRLHLENP